MLRSIFFTIGLMLLMVTWATGQTNQYYLNFDGNNDYVKYYNDEALQKMDGATDYTIEAWINPTPDAQIYDRILQRYYSFNIVIWHVTADKDSSDWYFTVVDDAGDAHYFNAKQSIAFGVWNHIAVINNSSEGYLKLFVNGVDVTKENYTNFSLRDAVSNDNFYVGQKGNGTDFFSGDIDEVRLKNVAIDPAELNPNVQQNYEADENTVVLLHFDEGQGSWTENAASPGDSARLGGTDIGDDAEPTWEEWEEAAIGQSDEFLPQNFYVGQNYPNPFNPVTTIPFYVPRKGDVRIAVFDLVGKKLFEKSGVFSEGHHHFAINAGQLATGIYIYQVVFGAQQFAGKMVLVK